MGEPFEGSKYLLSLADEIIEIKTICSCSKKATMNIRIDTDGKRIDEGDQVQIGGNESYVSVCRADFFKMTR
jgi:thymidine kinase